MEGENILQCILKGDTRQLPNIQKYVAPLQKFLDNVNNDGRSTKKAVECGHLVSEHGVFCMKLLRYCIEVLQKKKELPPEGYFSYSEIGLSLLSEIITNGSINVGNEISITGIIKLLFHLVISALKRNEFSYLLKYTDYLLKIAGEIHHDVNVVTKDAISICKQTSDHLWNAAIKLEQVETMDKEERSKMALLLRKNCLFLLSIAKHDTCLVIERGLKTARQYQVSSSGVTDSEELQNFLFSLLENVLTFMDSSKNHVKEDDYNLVEELCINCCKTFVSTTYIAKLEYLFSSIVERSKSVQQERQGIFHTIVQILLCTLCFTPKNKSGNIAGDIKWFTVKRSLSNIVGSLKTYSGANTGSHLTQAIDYMRSSFNKFLNQKNDPAFVEKVPHDVLSSIVCLCFIFLEKFNQDVRPSCQMSSNNSWKQNVQTRLTMLYFISSLILKDSKNGLSMFLQNGKKISFKCKYVTAVAIAKTMLDELVKHDSAVVDHYRYLATDAFNIGLTFLKNSFVKEATTLARLSCQAGDIWSTKKTGDNSVVQVLLFKKYELLSDCLEKQEEYKESLSVMTHCCQIYAMSVTSFADEGHKDSKALEYVEKWSNKKHGVCTAVSDHSFKKCNLLDHWKPLVENVSYETEKCLLLKMELDSYKRKRYDTNEEEICAIDKLLNIYDKNNDVIAGCQMKLEKMKVMYQMKLNAGYIQFIDTCEELIEDISAQHITSLEAQDLLASTRFWLFILKYSQSMYERCDSKEEKMEKRLDDGDFDTSHCEIHEDVSVELWPESLAPLQEAVNIWTQILENLSNSTEEFDVIAQNELFFKLQITSSIFQFFNMPSSQILVLELLTKFSEKFDGGINNLETIVVAQSYFVRVLCEEGRISYGESIMEQCEKTLDVIGDKCNPAVKHLFSIEKAYLFLMNGLYMEGWKLVINVVQQVHLSKKAVYHFILLKAKMVCWRYLCLPRSEWEPPFEDKDHFHLEFLHDSLKRAEALVDYLIEDKDVHKLLLGNQKDSMLLTHWSVLSELFKCLMEAGKVFSLQGAVREAKCYLEDGQDIASKYLSPIRFCQFAISLAELSFFKGETSACEVHLQKILEILQPNQTFSNIVNCNSLMLEQQNNDPHQIILVKLNLQLLICYCQYLKKSGNISDARTVLTITKDHRRTLVEQSTISLVAGCDDTMATKYTQNTSKRATKKTRAKKEKNASIVNEKKNEQMNEVIFLESDLKILAIESEISFLDGDYTTLLSCFQQGLELLKNNESLIRRCMMIDKTSISSLFYIRGVAHVLSSESGFDCWSIAGHQMKRDESKTEEVTEILSQLDISDIIENIDASTMNQDSTKTPMCQGSWQDVDPISDLDDNEILNTKQRNTRSRSRKETVKTNKKTRSSRRTKLMQKDNTEINEITLSEENEETKKEKSTGKKSKSRSVRKKQQTSSDQLVCEEKKCNKQRKKCSRNSSKVNVETVNNQADKEMLQAVECFNIALEYLCPYYNPVLLSRISHALLLCHGTHSATNAAIYQNICMATTLRHQGLLSAAKKIRKIKDELECIEAPENKFDTNQDKKAFLQTIRDSLDFEASHEELEVRFRNLIELLPREWTVCTLSLISSPEKDTVKYLVISRLRKNMEPLVLKIKLPTDGDGEDEIYDNFQTEDSVVRDLFAVSRKNIVEDFDAIFQESRSSMNIKEKRDWWKKRGEIDEHLQRVLQRLEDTWFGMWRGILCGSLTNDEHIDQLKLNLQDIQSKIVDIFGTPIKNEQLLEVIIEWYSWLKLPELAHGIAQLTGMDNNCKKVTKFCKEMKKFFEQNDERNISTCAPRGPVVLVLDKAIQHLPFESIPILREQEVSRMPSLDFIMSHLRLQSVKTSQVDILTTGVDTNRTFYVLNPKKDLVKTEKIFQQWFSTEEGWNGVVGRPPTAVEVKDALSSRHLYLYLGHGTGREFFNGDEIQRLYCQAVTILMGCSSGRLIVQGDCDARGMVLNYLLSGCPAVVANLWDVTDGDIDRFSSALFKLWLKKDNEKSLTECVSQCRKACLMKYLIGSAPVVYGMPVYTKKL